MVFLNKPHNKQYTDVFDTSIKNIFIFKIYTYFYLTSIYTLYVHYLRNTHPIFNTIITNTWFLFINIFLSFVNFIIINRNYHIYPINRISNTLFSLTSSHVISAFMSQNVNNSVMLSLEIVTNIILLSIVIYTFLNDLHPFILKQLLIIFIPIYLFTVSIILYSKMVSYNQFGILLLYSIFIFIIHFKNINIITKRYMPNDFYLAYLNIYYIFIDIFDIIIFDILVEMFMPKRKYKSYKKY